MAAKIIPNFFRFPVKMMRPGFPSAAESGDPSHPKVGAQDFRRAWNFTGPAEHGWLRGYRVRISSNRICAPCYRRPTRWTTTRRHAAPWRHADSVLCNTGGELAAHEHRHVVAATSHVLGEECAFDLFFASRGAAAGHLAQQRRLSFRNDVSHFGDDVATGLVVERRMDCSCVDGDDHHKARIRTDGALGGTTPFVPLGEAFELSMATEC